MTTVLRRPLGRAVASVVSAAGRLLPPGPAPRPGPWRIAVLRLDALGDFLLSLPALAALRAARPADRLVLAVPPACADLARGLAPVDEVVPLQVDWFLPEGRRPLRGYGAVRRFLAQGAFDAALDLRGDLRAVVAMRRAGVPVRSALTGTGGGPWLTHPGPYPAGVHAREVTLAAVRALAPDAVATPAVPLPCPAAWRVAGERLLEGAGLPAGTAYLVLKPGAGTAAKRWPAARFGEAAAAVRAATGWTVVATGAPSDEPAVRAAAAAAGGAIAIASGIGLTDLAGILAGARCVLANDSGPAHLAATLGVPTVVAFSGTAVPALWAPHGSRVTVLSHPVPCSPCALRECPVAGHPCLSGIPVAEVVRAALALAGPGATAPRTGPATPR